jgi:hypothetical protein
MIMSIRSPSLRAARHGRETFSLFPFCHRAGIPTKKAVPPVK